MMGLVVQQSPAEFSAWEDVHRLLVDCFAYMDGRIDPPSSLTRMTARTLAEKAKDERLILAWDGALIVGCGFLSQTPDAIYLGKVAVAPDYRGQGILRAIVDLAEDMARQHGKRFLELQTRIELTENHEAFAAVGFGKVGETSHEGYSRPTSVTMRRPVSENP